MDTISKTKRSEVMSKVRAKNTKPEIAVRKLLHHMGLRFRLHRNDLPGKPDICLPKYKAVIFVHGCFWHRHAKCQKTRMPKSNLAYWETKFANNIERDKQHKRSLKKLGWTVITVWECEVRNGAKLQQRLRKRVAECDLCN